MYMCAVGLLSILALSCVRLDQDPHRPAPISPLPPCTPLTNQTPKQVYTKPYISEADLHDPSLRTRVPALAALLEREDLTTALTMPDMPLRAGMNVCGYV